MSSSYGPNSSLSLANVLCPRKSVSHSDLMKGKGASATVLEADRMALEVHLSWNDGWKESNPLIGVGLRSNVKRISHFVRLKELRYRLAQMKKDARSLRGMEAKDELCKRST